MITIILLSLFITVLSLSCEEQMYAIDTIIINKEINGTLSSCPCIIDCLCNRYKVTGNTLTSKNGCSDLRIIYYLMVDGTCSVFLNIDDDYLTFPNTADKPMIMGYGGINSKCDYYYPVTVKLSRSISKPSINCLSITIILLAWSVLLSCILLILISDVILILILCLKRAKMRRN